MAHLIWDDLALLELLGVAPEVDEDKTSYHYLLEQDPLQLELAIFPYSGDVSVRLAVKALEMPVLEISLMDCAGLRVINDGRGRFMEIGLGRAFGHRYDPESPTPFGFRLWVEPNLRLQPYTY